jgi:hypothetical protein
MRIEFTHHRAHAGLHAGVHGRTARLERLAGLLRVGLLVPAVVALAWGCANESLSWGQAALLAMVAGPVLWGLPTLLLGLVLWRSATADAASYAQGLREERVRMVARDDGLEVVSDTQQQQVLPWDLVSATRLGPSGGLVIQAHGPSSHPYLIVRHALSSEATDASWEAFCAAVLTRAVPLPSSDL